MFRNQVGCELHYVFNSLVVQGIVLVHAFIVVADRLCVTPIALCKMLHGETMFKCDELHRLRLLMLME